MPVYVNRKYLEVPIFLELFLGQKVPDDGKELINASGLTIGEAIWALRQGFRVTRNGWNGKDMWLTLSPAHTGLPANNFWSPHNRAYAESKNGYANVNACISMKTAAGNIQMGWLASQEDLLANDWLVLPND